MFLLAEPHFDGAFPKQPLLLLNRRQCLLATRPSSYSVTISSETSFASATRYRLAAGAGGVFLGMLG